MNQGRGLTHARSEAVIRTLEEVEIYLVALGRELDGVEKPGTHWTLVIQA